MNYDYLLDVSSLKVRVPGAKKNPDISKWQVRRYQSDEDERKERVSLESSKITCSPLTVVDRC